MRILILLLFAAVAALIVLVMRLYGQRKRDSEQIRQLRQALDEAQLPHADAGMQEIRLRVLQNQINPHFLYNTLESIRSLAICGNPEDLPQIADMTAALARYFRYNISYKSNIVSLDLEINNVEQYMMIQRFRFQDRFELFIDIDEAIPIRQIMIPKLLLQPIVENSIFHGLETKMDKGAIWIRVIAPGDYVRITVEDNGTGIPDDLLFEIQNTIEDNRHNSIQTDDEDSRHNGVALWQINQQVKNLFGPEYGLQIYSTVGVGTTVEIRLPMISADK